MRSCVLILCFFYYIKTQSDLCNGGDLSSDIIGLFNLYLGWGSGTETTICPEDCVASQSCSEEVLLEQAREVCRATCDEALGLSLYPNATRTEPYSTSSLFNCPKPFFDAPTLAEPAACEVKGTLPQTIKLTDKSEPGVKEPVPSPSPTTGTASGAVSALCGLFAPLAVVSITFLLA